MRYDVAVVGGGPAGAWAAHELARRGVRVALVDASHPREKPCGGGVTGRALALVGAAVDAANLPAVTIRTARFIDSEDEDASASVALRRGALVVASRSVFDAALFDSARRAGADWIDERAIDVNVDRGEARVLTRARTLNADVVIGADGANSLTRRRLAAAFRREQLSIATGFFAYGTSSDEIVLEMQASPAGYLWSFPRPDHLAIGICAQASDGDSAASLRSRAARWIANTRLAPQASLAPYSWPIPSLSPRDCDAPTLAGRRWCLVGDAAGLVDPITREGIFFALASGGWAAEAFVAHGSEFHAAYAERARDEAFRDLACAARLKAGFFRPAFTRLMLRALRESSAVRDVMADLVSGEQPYGTLKWRLLQTLEFGLAWRALRQQFGVLKP